MVVANIFFNSKTILINKSQYKKYNTLDVLSELFMPLRNFLAGEIAPSRPPLNTPPETIRLENNNNKVPELRDA